MAYYNAPFTPLPVVSHSSPYNMLYQTPMPTSTRSYNSHLQPPQHPSPQPVAFSSPPNSIQHERLLFLRNHSCAVCSVSFAKNMDLEEHALNNGHSSFGCICGSSFARASCLTRHINSHTGPKFQCSWCDAKSFARLDKLRDHLRNFHKFNARSLHKLEGQNLSLPDAGFESGSGASSPDYGAATPVSYQHRLSEFELGSALPDQLFDARGSFNGDDNVYSGPGQPGRFAAFQQQPYYNS